MLKFLICITSVFQITSTQNFTEAQKIFVTLLNDIRAQPSSFAKYIEQNFINSFEDKIFQNEVTTQEGSVGFKKAARKLRKLSQRFPVELNQYLCYEAEQHSQYMMQQKKITHYRDQRTLKSILDQKGKIVGKISQIVFKIDKKIKSLIKVFGFLLADDGVPDKTNQKALMDYKFEQIGIGFIEDNSDCYATIILSQDFQPLQQFRDEISQYKFQGNDLQIIEQDKIQLQNLTDKNEQIFDKIDDTKKNEKIQNLAQVQQVVLDNDDSNHQLQKIKKLYQNLDQLTKSVKSLNQFYKCKLRKIILT